MLMPVESDMLQRLREWITKKIKKKTKLYAIYVKTHLKYDDIGLLK